MPYLKKILLGIFLLLCLVSLPHNSYAISEIGISDGDVEVTTSPDSPEPYQDVTITLASYATDLNKASIEWQSGGKVILSGIGRTSYTFTAQGANSVSVISIKITTSSGDTVTKQVVVNPSDLDLLWEGVNSHVPPFYKGKNYAAPESLIRVVAIPNARINPKKLTYNWKNNDSAVQSASGYGKDSYVFANSELRNKEVITVTASSVDGSYNATKTITIPIVNPKIVFYKKSPTEGVLYNNALQDEVLFQDDETTVVAEPYFFELGSNDSNYTYNWIINDQKIDTPSRKTELTVKPSSRGGFATIALTIENLKTFFQKVSGQLKINL